MNPADLIAPLRSRLGSRFDEHGHIGLTVLREVKIRRATEGDSDEVWSIFKAVIAPGDTYAFDSDMSRADAMDYLYSDDTSTYVAESAGRIVGIYFIRANQPGLGSHIANAGFMVWPGAQRTGIGRKMAEHCLEEARRLGFCGIQFNFVVSTNQTAISLWKSLGFSVVGTVPGAFRHSTEGIVDVLIMFRKLTEE